MDVIQALKAMNEHLQQPDEEPWFCKQTVPPPSNSTTNNNQGLPGEHKAEITA